MARRKEWKPSGWFNPSSPYWPESFLPLLQRNVLICIRSANFFLKSLKFLATNNFHLDFEKLDVMWCDVMSVEASKGLSWPHAWRIFVHIATGYRKKPGWSNLWENELSGIQRSYNDIVGKILFSESGLSQCPICSAGYIPPFRKEVKACSVYVSLACPHCSFTLERLH